MPRLSQRRLSGFVCFLSILLAFTAAINLLQLEPIREAKAQGHTYYVATNGSDSNPGTISQPWKTIQKAADTLQPGDTVYIREGTYTGNVNLRNSGRADNYITFMAYSGEQPVLDGAGGGRNGFTDRSSSSRVEYFIIDGFEVKNYLIGIELERSSNFIVRNNTVHDLDQHGISSTDGTEGEIANNKVYNVGDYSSGYTGIFLERVTNYEIHHNVVYACHHNGIMLSYQSDYNLIYSNIAFGNNCGDNRQMAGIAIEVDSEHNKVYNNLIFDNCNAGYLSNSPNNEIYHNTIFGNLGQVSFGDWKGSVPTGNIIKNNIFIVTPNKNNAVAFWRDSTSYDPLTNTFDYNLYYYVNGPDKSNMVVTLSGRYTFSQWQATGKEKNGILADPKLVNPNNQDFHLQSNSPAIDAGANVGVAKDFDGNSRPQGAGYDIGAYEYGGTQPRPTSTPTPRLTLTPTPTPGPSFNLNSGWNQISWRSGLPSYTSKTSLEDVNQDCGSGTGLVFARKNKGFWEEFILGYGGLNFNLQTNQIYFLRASKNCTWTP